MKRLIRTLSDKNSNGQNTFALIILTLPTNSEQANKQTNRQPNKLEKPTEE